MTETVIIIPADRAIKIDSDDNIESVIKDRLTYLKNLNDIIIEKGLSSHIVKLDTLNEMTILGGLLSKGIFEKSCSYLYKKYRNYVLNKYDSDFIQNFLNKLRDISRANDLIDECDFLLQRY